MIKINSNYYNTLMLFSKRIIWTWMLKTKINKNRNAFAIGCQSDGLHLFLFAIVLNYKVNDLVIYFFSLRVECCAAHLVNLTFPFPNLLIFILI